jgi:MoaA/NifB/PqqE/SkfB family radical SAM enzyme
MLRSKIIQDAAKLNIPVLGEFELTSHCNLNCKMCYVVDQETNDLTLDEWKSIFYEAYQAGLLFALLTGGEVFIRKDFPELYNYLFDLGVRITVFTNGTFFSNEILDTFRKRPPEFLAITVYGATNETYELITGKKDGFTKLNETLDILRVNNINTVLRTIPLVPIYQEEEKIIEWAKKKRLNLFYTQYIGPSNKCDFPDETLRLNAKELLDFSLKIDEAFGYDLNQTETSSVDAKSCAALKSGYFINHQGLMQPCAMAYKPSRSILGEESFLETFQVLSKELKVLEEELICKTCKDKDACIQCYARRLLEGDSRECSSYLKAFSEVKTKK